MPEPEGSSLIRFDGFRFDERSGELHRPGDGEARRLPPQPTRLLSHLIRRGPAVVLRDEIAGLLWPDVAVDVEQSIHACIRQIRAALGDSANRPRFVETIPRRGYRFIGTLDGQQRTGRPDGRARRPLRLAIAVLAAVAIVTAAVLVATGIFRSEAVPPVAPRRIAVMPFEPLADDAVLDPGNGIAESIVRILAGADPPAFEVIGPTTTQSYDGNPQRLSALIEEFEIDLVVNARQTRTDGRVLIELIRAGDGAHVWVRYLDELPEGRDPSELIAEAVAEQAGS